MNIQEKIALVKNLYKEYNDKLNLFNELKAELQALSQQKLSWYSGTLDDIVANWTAIEGKLLQIKQEKARVTEVEVSAAERPTVEVIEERKKVEEGIKKWWPLVVLGLAALGEESEETYFLEQGEET